ncbi:MAG: hypothetical protein ACK4TN_05845 [Brevinematales bacterium]
MNDDVGFDKDFLQNGVEFVLHHQKTLLLAQSRSLQTGEIHDVGTKIDWKYFTFRNVKEGEEIDCLATRGLFMRVGDLLSLGGFHPFLLPHYLSDYEYTIRAKRKGFLLATTKEVWLWMDEEKTGYHEVKGWKSVFSKKSSINPFYLFNFILLSCPWKYKLEAFYYGIVKKIIKYFWGIS